MQVERLEIPITSTFSKVHLCVYPASGNAMLFEEEDAVDYGESKWQLQEGCTYEYELVSDALLNEKKEQQEGIYKRADLLKMGYPPVEDEEKIEVFLNNLEVKLASEIANLDKSYEESEEQNDNQESAEGAVAPVSTFKVLLDGETIEEAEQFDTYLAALKKMGMDIVEICAPNTERR